MGMQARTTLHDVWEGLDHREDVVLGSSGMKWRKLSVSVSRREVRQLGGVHDRPPPAVQAIQPGLREAPEGVKVVEVEGAHVALLIVMSNHGLVLWHGGGLILVVCRGSFDPRVRRLTPESFGEVRDDACN